ncbi:MAG: tRNA (guanosine(37)-N1)-methyltransferase TrmD [Clostridia bacterium]|nr:tRNA (guanosine(37)-N1)-methyltransferase TrmD [Clostridia bacterium]
MRFDIMTLFPDLVDTVLSESIIGRAQKQNFIEIKTHNIRDYANNKHNKVDDTPYGGGFGMLMAAPPICDCYDAIIKDSPDITSRRTVYLSPRGCRFDQKKAAELSKYDQLILLCGHYEGVDQRAIDLIVDEEISIGDFVLTGGEIPACIVVDAVSRLCDGVLSDSECYKKESFGENGLLEFPQYTRPFEYKDLKVPEVLLSGHHENIDKWREGESLKITKQNRPDLLEKNDEKD